MLGPATETVGVPSFAAKAYLYNMSSLRVSLVQADLVWENKQANLEKLELMINSLRGKTELVLLPEMFSTGFSMRPELLAETMEGEAVAWMKRIAKENRIILAGSLIIREHSDEDKAIYFNRLACSAAHFPLVGFRLVFWVSEDSAIQPGFKIHCCR